MSKSSKQPKGKTTKTTGKAEPDMNPTIEQQREQILAIVRERGWGYSELKAVIDYAAATKEDFTVELSVAQLLHEARSQDMKNMSGEQLLESFRRYKKFSPATARMYVQHMNKFFFYLNGVHESVKPYEVTRKHVRDYAFMMEGAAHPNGSSMYKATTIKARLAAITAFYDWLAYYDDEAPANPARDVMRPKVEHEKQLTLEEHELFKLLNFHTTARESAIVWILSMTGMRAGELTRLQWSNIDWEHGLIDIPHAKGDKKRTVPIPPDLPPRLQEWKNAQAREARKHPKIAAALMREGSGYVLLTREGNPFNEREVWRLVKRRAAQAGIKPLPGGKYESDQHSPNVSQVTPHTLRRTFATMLLRQGTAMDIVADILGHKSVDTTRNHYAFSHNERTKKAVANFEVRNFYDEKSRSRKGASNSLALLYELANSDEEEAA